MLYLANNIVLNIINVFQYNIILMFLRNVIINKKEIILNEKIISFNIFFAKTD